MQIRPATQADLDFVKACALDAYSKYVERIGKPPAPMVADFSAAITAGNVSVALLEKDLTGFVVFYPVDNEMHLENVAVLPEHCGKGIGRALISHVEKTASTLGLTSVYLYTNEAMTENLQLYPVLGYREYKRASEAGFNRVYYRKSV